MTTASTNTTVSHAADANYRTWVAEIIAQLIAVGLTQTADTGQVDTATVTRPAINTVNAYAIFRFNDVLHATNPIFIRIDFGTGSAATTPGMRVSVGRGTNGAGTLTGLVTTRVGCNAATTALASTAIAYTSRFCYDATQGFLGFTWKLGALNANACHGGFMIFRSVDSAGAPTADATIVIANGATDANGATGNAASMQVISHTANLVYNTAPFPTTSWTNGPPCALTNTLVGSDVQVFPVWQYTPRLGITNQLTVALQSEIGLNATATINILGALTNTYINVGSFPGCGTSFGITYSAGTHGLMMLWQ